MFGWLSLAAGPGLGLEPAEVGRVGQQVGAEHLEGDRAVEADLAGEIDLAHPAPAEQPLDLEVAERQARQITD